MPWLDGGSGSAVSLAPTEQRRVRRCSSHSVITSPAFGAASIKPKRPGDADNSADKEVGIIVANHPNQGREEEARADALAEPTLDSMLVDARQSLAWPAVDAPSVAAGTRQLEHRPAGYAAAVSASRRQTATGMLITSLTIETFRDLRAAHNPYVLEPQRRVRGGRSTASLPLIARTTIKPRNASARSVPATSR